MSELTVTFLGSGDAFSSGGRLNTCILVEGEDKRFLLDCGASSLAAMKSQGVDPKSIDTILITHLHGDHFGGLPFMIIEARFVSPRERPLTVVGPPGLEQRVIAAMEMLYPNSSQALDFVDVVFIEIYAGKTSTIGELQVTPYEVIHPSGAPSYALRVEYADKVITYSGDTEWTDVLPVAARDAHLFICEAGFYDRLVPNHLSYATLLARREEFTCKQFVLTHMSDEMLAQLPDIEFDFAADGKSFVV